MIRILSIFGLVFALAAIAAAPGQDAFAADMSLSAPMLQMDDGTPCQQKNCAKMPDCPMVLPGLSVSAVVSASSDKLVFKPVVQTVRFAPSARLTLLSLEGSGLRRPPRI